MKMMTPNVRLVSHPKSAMLLVLTVDFVCQRPENINCQSPFERQSYIFDSNQQTLLTTLRIGDRHI